MPITAYDPSIAVKLPQGAGSGLNSDQVDGYNASINPAPNQLLPLGPTGKFPVSVIPISGGGGSGFLLGNGSPTDKNILVADGSLWQSRTMSGDATISSDTGVLTLSTSGVTAGTYGLEDSVPTITFDAKGRATAASNTLISITAPQIKDGTGSGVTFTTYTSTSIFPESIAFDGTNMWIANANGVSKVTATGTFTTYNGGAFVNANSIAFDGTNMWAADNSLQIVGKITPTGTITTFSTSPNAGVAIAFDGTNMWVAGGTGVSKITPSGSITQYSHSGLSGIAFDGTNMWATDLANDKIVKISPAGSFTDYSLVATNPLGIAFDGTNMWTSNIGDDSVSKVDPSGTETNYPGTGNNPRAIAFDGTNMWTANTNDDSVTIVDASGGMSTFSSTGDQPYFLAKKTSHEMWSANLNDASVTKIVYANGILGIVNSQIDPTAEIDVTKLDFPLLGDLLYGGTSGNGTVLSGNITSTKKFLTQTGTGSVSAAPSWATIVAGDVPTLNQNTTGTASNITASSNSTLTSISTLTTIGALSSLVMAGTIKIFGDTTGSGTVIGLGTNSPASTLTAPYTWVKLLSSDGSTVWVPAYK